MHKYLAVIVISGSLLASLPAQGGHATAKSPISDRKRALIVDLMRSSNMYATESDVFLQLIIVAMGKTPNETELKEVHKNMSEDAETREGVEAMLLPIYDEMFTEEELTTLVAFFKSGIGKKFADLQVELQQRGWPILQARAAGGAARDSEHQRFSQTNANIFVLVTASETYAIDHNAYPDPSDMPHLASVLSPTYVADMPQKDGWGHPFVYIVSDDKAKYRFVSGGPDGKIDPESLTLGTKPRAGTDDFIYENGEWLANPLTMR